MRFFKFMRNVFVAFGVLALAMMTIAEWMGAQDYIWATFYLLFWVGFVTAGVCQLTLWLLPHQKQG